MGLCSLPLEASTNAMSCKRGGLQLGAVTSAGLLGVRMSLERKMAFQGVETRWNACDDASMLTLYGVSFWVCYACYQAATIDGEYIRSNVHVWAKYGQVIEENHRTEVPTAVRTLISSHLHLQTHPADPLLAAPASRKVCRRWTLEEIPWLELQVSQTKQQPKRGLGT